MTTSLFQGALLYTTQIWQHVEKAPAAFHDLMGKSYPPGIHQQMLFEVADGEWVHTSVMSGLTPDREPGRAARARRPARPDRRSWRMPPEEREKFTVRRREAYKTQERDELVRELPGAQPRDRSGHHDGGGARRERAPRTRSSSPTAWWPTVEDPELGATTQIGVPINLLGTPGAIQGPQPLPGEHNVEIFGLLGYSRRGDRRLHAEERDLMHALEGVRLVDFGQYLAGPFGPMIIGDLGAEVIKVEPVTGDGMRLAGKPFFGCQRGKRDIALDLKTPHGSRRSRSSSIERADIVHHNMTAGVANKLGIGYDDCKRVNPDVVYCNTWAYGLEGPLAHFGGLDPLYQAATGLEYEAGAAHTGNAPLYYRFGMCDAANAMLSVVGCLAALYHQRRTGEGQELWTSLLDGGAVFASDALLVDGEALPRPRLDQGLHGIDACYRLYETQDGWIQIAAVKEREWVALCRRARRAGARRRRAVRGGRPPRTSTATSSRACSRRASSAEDVDRRGPARSTTPACRTRSRSTRKAGELVLCRRRQRARSGSSPSTSTRSWG